MNLQEINTPAELLAANNNEQHTAESLFELACEELDMKQAHVLATMIVDQLARFHQHCKNELVDNNNIEAVAWGRDESYYHSALMSLNAVNNG
mgnify:CR=1 FL=1